MALIVKAAELVEHFQWLDGEESTALAPDKREEVGQELAGILICLICLICLTDKLGIDLVGAVENKITINEKKYPANWYGYAINLGI
jgi:dCTP diphosphatase